MKKAIIIVTVLLAILLSVTAKTDIALKGVANISIKGVNEETLSLQTPPALKLKYDFTAKSWKKEALPLGNGRIGAMVFVGVGVDIIQMNEHSLWSGGLWKNPDYNGAHLHTTAEVKRNLQNLCATLQDKIIQFSKQQAAYIDSNGKVIAANYFAENSILRSYINALMGDKTTDQLLAGYKNNTNLAVENLFIEQLYYQFGRYLLISYSRKNVLPANLQGIWAERLTPPWVSDYHTNINVQMSYCLAEPRIGLAGQFMEWKDELLIDITGDNAHRHVNHLFCLHPGAQIVAGRSPQDNFYTEAMKKNLNTRGDGGTGWSKAWKTNFRVRLQDGNRSHKLLEELLKESTLTNLFDTHLPFQIDGDFGATARITEMLIQSHGGYIELLPAIPDKWNERNFKGIKVRKNFELSANWKDKTFCSVEIVSNSGNICKIKYNDYP